MRYFKATLNVVRIPKNGKFNGQSNFFDLYEELDKKAVIVADRDFETFTLQETFEDADCDLQGFDNGCRFSAWAIVKDSTATLEDAKRLYEKACNIWGRKLVDADIKEATLLDDFGRRHRRHCTMLQNLGNGTMVDNARLHDLQFFLDEDELFNEWLVDEDDARQATKEDFIERAKECAQSKDLCNEIERIFAAPQNEHADVSGSLSKKPPVHYLIENSTDGDPRESLDVLLGALCSCGRLPSPHVFTLNFDQLITKTPSARDSYHHFRNEHRFNESFAHALAGNIVILEYGRHDDDSAEFLLCIYNSFKRCLEALGDVADSTLLIFSVPKKRCDLANRFINIADLPIASISYDEEPNARQLSFDEAMTELKNMAKVEDKEVDAELERMLKERMENASFWNLRELYRDWKATTLINSTFPAYKPELEHLLESHDLREPDAMRELDELIGLEEVKKQIKDILARIRMNKEVESAGLPVQDFSMHMMFMGSPGTGKTEVARLFGRILKEAGVLSEGRVITRSGSSGWDVNDTFDEARGSVLFIDEAYGMTGFDNKVAELVALMENCRRDTVVIFAGYESDMKRLLASNKGFKSRIGFMLEFEDYSPEQLLEIYLLMCKRAQLVPTVEAKRAARDILARSGRRLDQGNARYVRKLFEDSFGAQQVRLAKEFDETGIRPTKEQLSCILPCDLGIHPEAKHSAREELNALIGLDNVKKLVLERTDFLKMQRIRRDMGKDASNVSMNMAFMGAPGTGKTEVARLMGRILREEGVLSVGEFFEAKKQDLVSPMEGVSAAQVNALFQQARGSVIFIDEAYTLATSNADSATAEAVDALIEQMDNMRDEVVVIFAGYTNEIERLFKTNPGFASRVPTRIYFDDYSADELEQIFAKLARERGFIIDDDVLPKVHNIFARSATKKDFGNGRFARNLLEKAILRQSTRLAALLNKGKNPTEDDISRLIAEDIPSINEFWETLGVHNMFNLDGASDETLRRLAAHEAGHAICALAKGDDTSIDLVTIESEANGSLGHVQHTLSKNTCLSRKSFEVQLVCAMGGIAGEQSECGEYGAGCASDLERATEIATDMAACFGMGGVGFTQYLPLNRGRFDGVSLADCPQKVQNAVEDILDDAHTKAQDIIQANRTQFNRIVDALLEEKTLSRERVLKLWNQVA